MGAGPSRMRLPIQPLEAIRTLRAEVKRLQGDVRDLSTSYTNMTHQAYYNSLSTTLRDVLDYKREMKSKKLPDPDSMAALLALEESIASAACAAFNAYLDTSGAILLEPKPSLSAIASIYRSYGERVSNCLSNSVRMESNRRKGVRNGTMSILRQGNLAQRAVPVPRSDPVYRQLSVKRTLTQRKTKGRSKK